jgi:hypothetical protein
MRPVEDGRDPGIERAQRAHEIADARVFGPHYRACRSGDVAAVVRQQAVGQDAAKRALPHVPVRVDESRHDDHA